MVKIQQDIERVRELQKEIDGVISQIKSAVVSEVSVAQPGVRDIAPGIFTIQLSTLRSEGVWDPAYYCPQTQADAVQHALKNCRTPDQLDNAIQKMLETKRVRTASYNIPLNPSTLEALKALLQSL